jgi:hypothetical protein
MKRRLSSFLSSKNLAHDSSPHKSSTTNTQSHLNESTSSSTRASSPSRKNSVPLPKSYDSLEGKGIPPSAEHVTNGVHALHLGTDVVPLTESPASSPIIATEVGAADIKGEQGESAGSGMRKRSPSMYSQWDEEEREEEESEDEAYLTPDEGLSEVEEEEEEDELPPMAITPPVQAVRPVQSVQPVQPSTIATDATPIPASVPLAKVGVSEFDNYANTGPSTIHRTPTTVRDETAYIRKRVASSKSDALKINQFAVLSGDVDTCRKALTLFLTSRMRAAEDILMENDPDNNHLYLMNGHALLEGLKVSSEIVWRMGLIDMFRG